MSRQPRIISEQPNVENTIPLTAYRSQYPERFSLLDDDKFVLYGGGNNYVVHTADNSGNQEVEMDPALQNFSGSSVSVYVLNQCLVMWCNGTNHGIEIPYPSLALHAVKSIGNAQILHLQLLSSDVFRCVSAPSEYTQTIDLVIEKNEPNLANENALFSADLTIQQLYDALLACSALHFDSESDSDPDPFGPDHQWITADSLGGNAEESVGNAEVPADWHNSGDADDLEIGLAPELDGEAGMNVTVVSGQLAGVRRRNSQSGEGKKKVRK